MVKETHAFNQNTLSEKALKTGTSRDTSLPIPCLREFSECTNQQHIPLRLRTIFQDEKSSLSANMNQVTLLVSSTKHKQTPTLQRKRDIICEASEQSIIGEKTKI